MTFFKHAKKIYKSIFILLGCIFVLIGIIGIFLPLLPTTPFLILAAFLFDQGSPKFHHWLIHHRIFGPPIMDWKKSRVIRTKYKMLATAMLALSVITILKKETIPLLGKSTFLVFIVSVLLFIWTRKGKV